MMDKWSEGTTPYDASDWSNVEPEPLFAGNATAHEQTRLPSFAQSKFYTVIFCPASTPNLIRALARAR
jgi:hypothetical protein